MTNDKPSTPQVPENIMNEDEYGVACTVNEQTEDELHGIPVPEDLDPTKWPRIRLAKLELVNFGKYEDVVIDFSHNGTVMPMAVLVGPNGTGKCFAKGTPVLMFDGTTKTVESVVVGDVVMGNDSSPRKVLALHHGTDNLFAVKPTKGDSYIVNGSHVLVLKITGKNAKREYKSYEDSSGLVKITAQDFVKKPMSFQNLMVGFRTGVEFPDKTVLIDPYILGLWLGDGSSNEPSITTADEQILISWTEFATKMNLGITPRKRGKIQRKSNTYGISGKKGVTNQFTKELRAYNLIGNKHIPSDYKYNNRQVRLKVLAGMMDTDGGYDVNGGVFDYVSVSKTLANDVIYLARSLGFQAYVKECRKGCQTGAVGTHYRVSISGNCEEIPTLLGHKVARKRVINKNCLHVGITVTPCGWGEYFGFQTDGNNLFLLGDFTVVHNSTILDSVTMLCSNFSGYEPQRFSDMMFRRVRNWMHIQGDDRIKNASFCVRGHFEATYPVQEAPYYPVDQSQNSGLPGPVNEQYVVEFTRHKFRSRHPEFIEQRLPRYCFAARFDHELTLFQMRRERWPLFQELFSSVTGFPIEEDIDMFHDTADTRMRKIMDEYVLGFLMQKPKETIRHKMCSAGEKKIAKCFSTILNARVEPSVILVDNVLMHIEVGRHLAVMSSLSKCFPNSQLIVACHSVPVSKSLPHREQLFDMRSIEVPGLMWREPWRIRLLDDVNESLERLSSIDPSLATPDMQRFMSQGASLIRIIETDRDIDKTMSVSLNWLSNFPSYLLDDLFVTPRPKMRWHDDRQSR